MSAVITGGSSQRILDLAAAGRIRVIASPLLVDELRRVLARDRFLRWRCREDLDQFVVDVQAIAELVDDPTDAPPVTRDRNDDYLVALARAVHADAICSGDGDLAALPEIEVLTPAEL